MALQISLRFQIPTVLGTAVPGIMLPWLPWPRHWLRKVICAARCIFYYDMGDRSTITQTFFGTFLHRLYTEGDAEVLSN